MLDPKLPQTTLPVQAVLFDYGNVLSNPADATAWSNMLAVSGLSEPALHAAYWAHRDEYDRHILSGRPYWRAVGARGGREFTDDQIESLLGLDVDMWTSMNPPMIEFAQSLQAAGIRTGVLSNIGDAIARGIVARLPWLANFYHCTWSWSLGMAKPDPAIYTATAQALGTAADEILFVDDREENIDAAAALGFQTIRFTDYAAFVKELRAGGYVRLLDLISTHV